MSDKSNKYGYVGPEVTQAYKSNKGVFDISGINTLVANNKWTNPGQMELIEKKELSGSVSEIVFTNIKENEYQNHVLYMKNVGVSAISYLYFSSNGGSSYTTGYRYSNYYTSYNVGAGDERNNGSTEIYFSGVGNLMNGIMHMSNLGDIGKLASVTYHMVGPTVQKMGHGITTAANSWNAFKIAGATFTTGTFVLYGIKGNL